MNPDYYTNPKAFKRLQKWLDKNKDSSFRAEKLKRHRAGKSSFIPVGDTYYGEAWFAKHPWTGEKCMTFGRGLDGRMWTSPVMNARQFFGNKNVWLIKTFNSIYKLELVKS